MSLSYLIAYLSMGMIVLVALFSLVLINRRFDLSTNIFRGYFIVAALTDLIMYYLTTHQIVNIQIANLFCLVQLILVGLALINWIESPAVKRLMITLLVLFVALISIYVISIFRMNYLDPISTTSESALLALLSGYLLVYLTRDTSQYLFRNYKFWFVVAVFIYFSVTSVVYATSNFFIDEQTYLRHYTWVINSALNVIAGILYIKGLTCLPVKRS